MSVQFGYWNYCSNYDNQALSPIPREPAVSFTAETALIGPEGFIEYDGDDVQGHRTPEQVLELLNYAANLPAKGE